MSEFEVKGPFNIPKLKAKYGRSIDKESLEDFWEENPDIKDKRGIYVFGLNINKGSLPYYVGKASINFEKECFQSHKLVKYNDVFQKNKGNPIMYFLVQTGWKNNSVLNKAERFMIQMAYVRNNKLENIQGIKKEEWSIKGIHNSKQKKRSKDTNKFKKMLGLD